MGQRKTEQILKQLGQLSQLLRLIARLSIAGLDQSRVRSLELEDSPAAVGILLLVSTRTKTIF